MARIHSFRDTEERYRILRLLVGFFLLLGTLAFALGAGLLAYGLFGLFGGMVLGQFQVLAAGATVYSLGLLAAGFQILATAALLKLAIHVEENTRHTAQCLDQIRSRKTTSEITPGDLFRS